MADPTNAQLAEALRGLARFNVPENSGYWHDLHLAAQRLEAVEQICTTAICNAPSLDENGYICTKDAAIKAVRAALQAAREV
jgi:hypothetical protein